PRPAPVVPAWFAPRRVWTVFPRTVVMRRALRVGSCVVASNTSVVGESDHPQRYRPMLVNKCAERSNLGTRFGHRSESRSLRDQRGPTYWRASQSVRNLPRPREVGAKEPASGDDRRRPARVRARTVRPGILAG